jgi:CheY-like chemotaxis protein/HPt (histidine-containing phosphotransfer) domain-containing protein
MSGRVWVESQEGIGSTFGFTIAAQVVPTINDPLSQVHPSLQGKRLLIVDDHQTSRKILRSQLEKWGMICVDVATGAEALDSIQQGNEFDGALLDLQMPQMDGLSLGRLIHQKNRLPNVKLVIMSAVGCPVKLPDREFVECITKPIKISQVYQKLINLWTPYSDLVAPKSSESLNGKGEDKEDPKTEKKLAEKLADRVPLRILLAEDNVVNQKVALRILSRLGYTADVAKNGLEAIAALEAKPYDLVLMDIQMPKMDGIEATRQICEQWTPPISKDYATQVKPWIIAITAGATNGDRAECLAAGMDDYLNKPINVDLLKAALERLGERSKHPQFTSETEMMKKSAGQMQQSSPKAALLHGSTKSITPDDPITIDLTVLEKLRQELMTSEDSDVLGEIIALFLEDTPSLLTAIEEAIEAKDISTLRYAVHTLRGSTSNLGIQRMYHLCFQLQDLGTQGAFEEAVQTFTELQTEFMRVKAAFASQPEKCYE